MDKKENKTNMIHFRATDSELDFYRTKAKELNMPLSVLIRISLIEYLKNK